MFGNNSWGSPEVTRFSRICEGKLAKGSRCARIRECKASEADRFVLVSEHDIVKVPCLATISEYGSTEVTRFTRLCEGEVPKGSHFVGICQCKVSGAARFAMIPERQMIEVLLSAWLKPRVWHEFLNVMWRCILRGLMDGRSLRSCSSQWWLSAG